MFYSNKGLITVWMCTTPLWDITNSILMSIIPSQVREKATFLLLQDATLNWCHHGEWRSYEVNTSKLDGKFLVD